LSFEIQELPDIIRVIVLLNVKKGTIAQRPFLRKRIDKVCAGYACIEMVDLNRALDEMACEGLISLRQDGTVEPTEQGASLGRESQSLLLKKEPIPETVAGLTDGSNWGLVVILSAFIASLSVSTAAFAAFLTLAAVATTNFASFLLGGITYGRHDYSPEFDELQPGRHPRQKRP
jgi:hypothetical protein